MSAPLSAAAAFERARRRLRVLVVSAAPVGEGIPLNLRREWLLLQRQVREGKLPAALYRLVPPTAERLRQALESSRQAGVAPQVLHFAGHGEPGALALEDTLCRPAPLRRWELEEVLTRSGVRLLVLNACHTATRETVSLARYLQEQGVVEAAVGHERPVPDEAAARFSGLLYRGLCRGQSVLEAFALAQAELARSAPEVARATQLYGGDRLVLAGLDSAETMEPLVFDGTAGRGRMPEVPHFFGRAEDLVELGRFFEDDGMRVAAVAGIGGIGKTSLVQEAAGRHAWRFPGGMAYASLRSFYSGAPRAEDLVKNTAGLLQLPESSGPQLVEAVLGHLERAPGLLVFDNLEDFEALELERLLRFLEQLPLNGSKALLTLRPAPELLREWSWLKPVVLTSGLSPPAGASYVVHLARGRVPALTQGDLALRLTQELGGHPKMLEVAVGLAETQGLPVLQEAVATLGEAQATGAARQAQELAAAAMERKLEGLLATSLRLLDEDGRWVLGLLALFPDDTATREELLAAAHGALGEAAAAQAEARVRAGLDACLRAGLVDRDKKEDLYRLHAAVQAHARQAPAVMGDAAAKAQGRLLEAALAYVAAKQEDYPALERRLVHLVLLFDLAWQVEERQCVVAKAIDAMGYFFLHCGHWEVMAFWRERLRTVPVEDPRQHAHRLLRESMLLGNSGAMAEAKEFLQQALKIYWKLCDRQGHAACQHQLAIIEESQGNYGAARTLLSQSIATMEQVGDRRGLAASQHQLAIIEESQGNYGVARALLNQSIQTSEEVGDHYGAAASQHQLASIEQSQGNYGEARALLRQSSQTLEQVGDRSGLAASQHLLASIEECQGNYGAARALLRQSLMTKEEVGDRRGLAASQHLLASIEESQGNYEEARALLRQSIQISEEVGDRSGLAASQHQLAIIEQCKGNYGGARALLHQSSRTFDEVGDRNGLASSLHQLALIESRQGNHGEARALLSQSIQTKEEIGDRRGLAASQHQLAIIEQSQGNYGEARALLSQSIQTKEEVGDRHGLAASQHLLAIIEQSQGNYGEARALLRQSIQTAEEVGDRSGLAASKHMLAIIENRQGNHREARALASQSIQAAEELGDRQGLAASLITLGQLEVAAENLEEGRHMIATAVAIFEDLGSGDLPLARKILTDIDSARGSQRIAATPGSTSAPAQIMLDRPATASSAGELED